MLHLCVYVCTREVWRALKSLELLSNLRLSRAVETSRVLNFSTYAR